MIYSSDNYLDTNKKKKNSETSLQFKSIINNRYLRTKIFNHVNHIHQAIVDRHFIGREHQKGWTLIVKISQVVSLQEFIRINRTDWFIDHFDRVYDTIKLGCKDDNGVVKLDHDIVFKDLLDVIVKRDDSIALKFMLKRFKFTLQTIMQSVYHNRGEQPISIEVYQVLKRYNYINATAYDINVGDSLWYINNLVICVINSGDIAIFDQFCIDCLDPIKSIFNINYVRAYDDVFINIINKLNNNNDNNNNNNNNNSIIFHMVERLLNLGIDLRGPLFINAMKYSNNQEILNWIKNSFDSFDMFVDFYHQSNRWIERLASMDTLKLIDYREPKYNSFNISSAKASADGNLDYLRYMVNQNDQYLFKMSHLENALVKGQLKCVNFIIDAISQYAQPGGQTTKCSTIDASIMSLDLVQRLVNNPNIEIDYYELIRSSIDRPDILEYLLSLGSFSVDIEPSLFLQDPKSIQLLLNQPHLDQPTRVLLFMKKIPNIQTRPLELLYFRGHSLEILCQENMMQPPNWRGAQVADIEVLQLIIKHQSIQSLSPWIIMTRYSQYDDHIELLKDAIVAELAKNEPIHIDGAVHQVFNTACKNGLIKVVECFDDYIGSFAMGGFEIALANNQIQVAKYLGQELAKIFSKKLQTKETTQRVILSILSVLNRVEDDQVFEYFWNLFKALTTNSVLVSRAIGFPSHNRSNNRHLTTNRVDRMIKHYGQYYNGCERDEYQMKPLTLLYGYQAVVINHIITKYQNDVLVNQFIDIKSFDYFEYYKYDLKLCLIPPVPIIINK
ncbi:hypothetical protein DFA_10132 [Cavenderia fasciculata]|uniref:Uncharacterized protein n=1 Tax=Cavenderia fasciculata TaxID=261658 RepID=F4Q9C9_CACFS|nr:uncharacterized protein DFA_10132 [Cavenderia fasciculata]EGG15298.1 hypothetical protein DFA_10132 [Cavenderia fasciculata]|eukprot:XP_004352018.1 hypothetical protein DFA_10132 [Cavenderia fasciculata]